MNWYKNKRGDKYVEELTWKWENKYVNKYVSDYKKGFQDKYKKKK